MTNDREKAGEEIILKLLDRWRQENDFKYEKKHFGLDEITSYLTAIPYEKLQAINKDKEVKSGEYKAIESSL